MVGVGEVERPGLCEGISASNRRNVACYYKNLGKQPAE